jgi:hypothetical protein
MKRHHPTPSRQREIDRAIASVVIPLIGGGISDYIMTSKGLGDVHQKAVPEKIHNALIGVIVTLIIVRLDRKNVGAWGVAKGVK